MDNVNKFEITSDEKNQFDQYLYAKKINNVDLTD